MIPITTAVVRADPTKMDMPNVVNMPLSFADCLATAFLIAAASMIISIITT